MRLTATGPLRNVILLSIAIIIHIVFCLSLHYQFLNPCFYITSHAKGQGGPFFGIYQAGVNLINGESIYGCENYHEPKHVVVPYYHFYRYLPFCSLVSSVFVKVLKPWPAYWTWLIINEFLLAICIFLTIRLRRRYGPVAIAVSTFWLLYSPLYIELYMGQFCFTMSFLIFLILYPYIKQETYQTESRSEDLKMFGNSSSHPKGGTAPGEALSLPATSVFGTLAHGKPFTLISSICWVLSILLKSFTALYSLTLIRLGKKKLALAGIAAAVLTSIPYYIKHPQDLGWFLHLNFQPLPGYVSGGCMGFNILLRDIFNRFLTVPGTDKIRLGFFDVAPSNFPIMIILAAIILITFLLTVRKKRIDPLSNISLWTLTFFLVFKDIWEYHYVMLIPLFAGFYLRTRSKYLLALFILLAVPTPFFFYDIPTVSDPQTYWPAPLSLFHHSFKAVPTFLFYLWVVKRELKDSPGFRSLFSFRKAAMVSLHAG